MIEHFYLQFLIQLLKNSQSHNVLFRGQEKSLNLLYSVKINMKIIKNMVIAKIMANCPSAYVRK